MYYNLSVIIKLGSFLERRSCRKITIRILNNTCFYIRNKLWILLASRFDWWQEHSVHFVVTVRHSIHINNMKFVSILRHREKLRNCYLDISDTSTPVWLHQLYCTNCIKSVLHWHWQWTKCIFNEFDILSLYLGH